MVDPWPASARLWRTPWSSSEEEDPSGAAPYAPIGLEAWRPPEPLQYGITYEAPKPEPYEEFAKSWLAPVRSESNQTEFEIQPYPGWLDQPGQEQRLSADSVLPADDRTPADSRIREVRPSPWGAFVMPGIGGAAAGGAAAAGAGTSAAGVGASAASAAGEFALPAAAHVGRAAVAGTASAVAAPAVVAGAVLTPTNSQNRSIDLGDGRRLVWPNGTLSFELQKSDGGIFNSGFLESWKPTDGSVRDELQNHPELNLDRIRKAFGEDGAALALLTMKSDGPKREIAFQLPEKSLVGNDTGPEPEAVTGAVPSDNGQERSKPVASYLDDYFSRRILKRQPDLIQREADGAALDSLDTDFGDHVSKKAMDEIFASRLDPEEIAKQRAAALVGLTDDQRERMEACWDVQRLLNEKQARQYRGENGQQTAVGVTMPPDLHESTAGFMRDSQNIRHRNGMIGEYHVTNAIREARPGEQIIHFVNQPGAHGPDVLSIGPDDNLMGWDAKFREQPQPVGPRMAQRPELDRSTVRWLLRREVEAGRLDQDRADRVWKNFESGNSNFCTAGTGNAYGGWVELLRNHKTLVKAR